MPPKVKRKVSPFSSATWYSAWGPGAPGVVARNAQLPFCTAYHGFDLWRQLVLAAGVLHFVRSIRQRTEHKAIPGKAQPEARGVGNGGSLHACARAALLRVEIRLQRRVCVKAEQPHVCAAGKIRIRLARSHTIIGNVAVLGRQCQHQAEFRHALHGLSFPFQRSLHLSIPCDGIGDHLPARRREAHTLRGCARTSRPSLPLPCAVLHTARPF